MGATNSVFIGHRGLQKGDWLHYEVCDGMPLIKVFQSAPVTDRIMMTEMDDKFLFEFIREVVDFVRLALFVATIHGFKTSKSEELRSGHWRIQML